MSKFKKPVQKCRNCKTILPKETEKFGEIDVYMCPNEQCGAPNQPYYHVLVWYPAWEQGTNYQEIHKFLTKEKRDKFVSEMKRAQYKYKIVSEEPFV